MKSKRQDEKLYEKFRILQKGLGTVLKELKQRALAKVAKIELYNERIKQYKQNWFFTIDEKKPFAELNGKTKEGNEIPDADQSRVFWSGIRSESKEHNRNEEWLKKMKDENNDQKHQKRECLFITRR